MAYFNGPSVVTQGMVFCLDAGNPKSYPGSGTTWYDLSGNGYNASQNGSPSWNAGGWFEFRNVDSDADHEFFSATFDENVLKNGTEGSSWTLEAWCREQGTPPSSESFIIGRIGHHGGIVQHLTQGINCQVRTTEGATGAVTITANNPATGIWTHVVMVWSGRTVIAYADGEYSTETTMGDNYDVRAYSDVMYVGGMDNNLYRSYGDISVVRAYNRGLSADEVKQNFESHRGRAQL